MPSKTPKARVATPMPNGEIPKRQALILSCNWCDLTLSISAFEDPEQGEGWPMHRCHRDVRNFTKARLDPFKGKEAK